MKIRDIVLSEKIPATKYDNVVGIDIGSRTAKAVLLSEDSIYVAQIPTGLYMQETAEELFDALLELSGLPRGDIRYIVGTGYGRIAFSFEDIPNRIVTEISCHAMGAHFLNPGTKTIIDIGGQDSKAIKVNPENGKVIEFIMNDKCAAGTGRFLEKVAGLLDYTIDEIGSEAVKSQKDIPISSQCVVFAESEVISLRARGESRKDIAAGIHFAAAKRVRNLVKRLGLEPELVFSGGVSNNQGMKHALEVLIGHPIKETKLDMIYAGALGASVYAQQFQTSHDAVDCEAAERDEVSQTLIDIGERLKQREDEFVNLGEKSKKVGYLCSYTPVEVLNAAGVYHTRLSKSGDSDTVAVGELMTKSVFCDFTKSCLGAFKNGDPLYNSLDKVYTFDTCDCMRRTAEAIHEFFVPTGIFLLPRSRENDRSKAFFRKEIVNFKEELEQLTGKTIEDKDISYQIELYNKVRAAIRKISGLRKRENPPISGTEFLELIKAYYVLPPEEQLERYNDLYERLSKVQNKTAPKLRIMMAGGIVADGDRRILETIENEIGARIVVEDHCMGLSPVYYDIREDEDPYLALSDGYLNQAPCARMTPIEKRLEFSGRLAREYKADAVIYTYLKFCPCYGLPKNKFLRYFQNMGLPVLELPSDYSQSDIGQLKTRIEAFLEVLSEKGGYENAN